MIANDNTQLAERSDSANKVFMITVQMIVKKFPYGISDFEQHVDLFNDVNCSGCEIKIIEVKEV